MTDSDLFDAVAQKTGEDSREIRRRGFMLTGSKNSIDPSKRRAWSVVEVAKPRCTHARRFFIPQPPSQRP